MIRDSASIAVDVDALVSQVADQFTEELKQGLSPDIEQYAQRHPQIAHIIRQVFPALAVLGDFSSAVQPQVEAGGHAIGMLGDFRLRREIGRGGMGIVYEAEQVSLGRRVALKVLPFAAVLDERQLHRFKNEAHAAATLHHTNIVPVFSVGCERGVHYYAMQYIEGDTLARLIAELQKKPEVGDQQSEFAGHPQSSSPIDTPTVAFDSSSAAVDASAPPPLPPGEGRGEGAPQSPSLPLAPDTIRGVASTIISEHSTNSRAYYRTVARLGIQAAEALEHAHQHGVIHRDIKPANLMLDAAGNLWIADFGLAWLDTDAGMTMTGDLIGTLSYMSPEQARGRSSYVDGRTDLYSLGVVIYELLTLRPIFNSNCHAELLRHVLEDEPTPPRRYAPSIPVDLETILLKLIAKLPSDRYATAALAVSDLRRFVDGKPILARRAPLTDRMAKWVRRHRWFTVATVVVLLLATLGSTLATFVIERERQAAVFERNEAYRHRVRADVNFRDAMHILEYVVSVLNDPAPVEVTRARVYERIKDFHKRFLVDGDAEPAIRIHAGIAHVHLGRIHQATNEVELARRSFARACQVFESLADASPKDYEPRHELAIAQVILGTDLYWNAPRDREQATMEFKRSRSNFLKVLELAPDCISAWESYAVLLATCADPMICNYIEAKKIAGHLVPQHQTVLLYFALGVAEYRLRNWAVAADALEAALRAPGTEAVKTEVRVVLAMAYCQLDQLDQAANSYQKAEAWLHDHPQNVDNYTRAYQAEAAALLRAKGVQLPDNAPDFQPPQP